MLLVTHTMVEEDSRSSFAKNERPGLVLILKRGVREVNGGMIAVRLTSVTTCVLHHHRVAQRFRFINHLAEVLVSSYE